MNTLDQLQEVLSGEIGLQAMYNHHAVNIMTPDVRQLFTQMRDDKTQNITQLQQQIQQLMQQGTGQ